MRNDSHYIHETVIRDIIDLATSAKEIGDEDIQNFGKNKSFRSAASASAGLTMVFPVLMSNTIGIEAANIIAKAIERKAVSMMQMLFSAVNITNAKDAFDYISKFHNNLDTGSMTLDSIMNTLDNLNVDESANIETTEQFKDRLDKEIAVKKDAKENIDYTLPDNVSENSLNIYRFSNNSTEPTVLREAPDDCIVNKKNSAEYFTKQLIPSDVKKANELVPTMITVNFTSYDGETPINVNNVVLGIKAKIYPLDSYDIINRIRMKNQDNNGFNKFIKATTREISFWKDFVFAIDKAKLDALSMSNRGPSNKLWKVLERRGQKSRLKRVFHTTNTASAISTLVVSREEVEYLKKEYNINIEDPKVMRPIMESYNLMGVVIVDEALEVASFMFDTGDDMYEQLSFNSLEREATDGSSKKIINLMAKMAR